MKGFEKSLRFSALLSLAFVLHACSKGPLLVPAPDEFAPKGEFRFLANGNPVFMQKLVSSNDNVQTDGNHLTFHAAGASGYVVSGCIYNFTGAGTYDLWEDSSGYVNFTINNWQFTMGAMMQARSGGKFIVSDVRAVDNYLVAKGEFSGVGFANNGYDSVIISDGVFIDPLLAY